MLHSGLEYNRIGSAIERSSEALPNGLTLGNTILCRLLKYRQACCRVAAIFIYKSISDANVSR
jgi:hypothetical protein